MKKKRVGSVYVVRDKGGSIGLLHYVSADAATPGSSVVSVRSVTSQSDDLADLSGALQLPILFYAHVFLRAGEVLSVWENVGHSLPKSVPDILWCSVEAAELRKPTSNKWCVWWTGESRRPPKNFEELATAEFGYVMAPDQIVSRILTGKYSLPIPAREW